MQSGKLREAITVQQKNITVSEAGEQIITWSSFSAGIRAGIETPTGREYFGQNKLNAQVSHVVKTRWIDGILPEMRILWGTRVLHITSVVHDEELRRWTVLHCEEIDQ